MSQYVKHTWKDGEIITADKLNNIEQGAKEAMGMFCIIGDVENNTANATYSQVINAVDSGQMPYMIFSYTGAIFDADILRYEGNDDSQDIPVVVFVLGGNFDPTRRVYLYGDGQISTTNPNESVNSSGLRSIFSENDVEITSNNYEQHEWENGQVITAENLNRIEAYADSPNLFIFNAVDDTTAGVRSTDIVEQVKKGRIPIMKYAIGAGEDDGKFYTCFLYNITYLNEEDGPLAHFFITRIDGVQVTFTVDRVGNVL